MLATDRLWKYSPPLFMTHRINLRHFGWIDYATFVMRRRRHPDWKCKGNRNVTREPEKGFSRPALSLSPRLQKWKILINESLHFSLYFPIFSNRCFIFFRSETGDWRRFSASAHLASWPTEKCFTMLNFFLGKNMATQKKNSWQSIARLRGRITTPTQATSAYRGAVEWDARFPPSESISVL